MVQAITEKDDEGSYVYAKWDNPQRVQYYITVESAYGGYVTYDEESGDYSIAESSDGAYVVNVASGSAIDAPIYGDSTLYITDMWAEEESEIFPVTVSVTATIDNVETDLGLKVYLNTGLCPLISNGEYDSSKGEFLYFNEIGMYYNTTSLNGYSDDGYEEGQYYWVYDGNDWEVFGETIPDYSAYKPVLTINDVESEELNEEEIALTVYGLIYTVLRSLNN